MNKQETPRLPRGEVIYKYSFKKFFFNLFLIGG